MTRRRGLPYVALLLDTHDPDVPAIHIDDFGGARAAARHLTALGHRRFAILSLGAGDDPSRATPEEVRAMPSLNVRERARGYWAALAEAGIAEEQVPFILSRSDRHIVRAAMDTLISGPSPQPTAILAMSDVIAIEAMDWLAEKGLRVPDDVSVVGFDATPDGAAAVPGLTTVAQPYHLIAERAVAAILDDNVPAEREILPLSPVVRDNTGPCREVTCTVQLGGAIIKGRHALGLTADVRSWPLPWGCWVRLSRRAGFARIKALVPRPALTCAHAGPSLTQLISVAGNMVVRTSLSGRL